MDNYQTQVIQAQINLLWHIRETHIADLTANQIGWIDDDITYVEVKFLDTSNDSSYADELRQEEPATIPFLEALALLSMRLNNTIEYLGTITDPDQSDTPNEPDTAKPTNIKLCYLYRDYCNYKNHNEVVFTNPDNLSIDQISTSLTEKLMDGEWFYASQWGLKDLHFEKWDDEADHPYHEFDYIEITQEPATHEKTITQFINEIPNFTQLAS